MPPILSVRNHTSISAPRVSLPFEPNAHITLLNYIGSKGIILKQ